MKTLVITSGYFNPIGPHHLNYLESARAFGDEHIVIVNNDGQVAVKQSVPFYNQDERLRLVKALKCVTDAIIAVDKGKSIAKTLEKIAFMARDGYNRIIFCNGGDQTSSDKEEAEICKKYGVQIMFGVGGGKVGSSSDYLKNAINWYNQNKTAETMYMQLEARKNAQD